MTFNVLDFDAKADRVADDAPAIQVAIDIYSKARGGRVALEGGRYFYPGPIILKENVDLHLERGAVLQAHKALEHYFHPNAGQKDDGMERVGTSMTLKLSYVFIYAKDADNIAISGEGVIDGNVYASAWQVSPYHVTGDPYPHPTLVYAKYRSHTLFKDATTRNASLQTLHPAGCDGVLMSGLRILNDLNVANPDGTDPDHSTSVRIIGCHVIYADNYICLESPPGNMEYGSLRDITISGCILTSISTALKTGTKGAGDFENMVVDNCTINGNNHGVSTQIRDGRNVRNASFSNIIIETRRSAEYWWGYAEPTIIPTHDRDEHTKSRHISDVRFSSITCDSENGVFLPGSRGSHIEDILFGNVRAVVRTKDKQSKGVYDLRLGYGQRIKEIKTSGFYMRRADHMILRSCQVKFEGEGRNDFSHALYAERCRDMTLENFRGQAVSSNLENVVVGQDKS